MSLWSGLGSKVAEKWLVLILTPAFAFWGGGVVAWAWHHGWAELGDKVTRLSAAEQVALAIGAFILVTASALLVQGLTLPVLRLLEGYWPGWLARPVIAWRDRRIQRYVRERADLAAKVGDGHATARQQRRHLALDRRLRRIPVERKSNELVRRMPTALGNVLRASESRPADKYGIDAVKCWPRLWLLLPETARSELTSARSTLDNAAGVVVWSVLFVLWSVWAWWSAPVGIAVGVAGYRLMLDSAATYGDLLESTYDVHRRLLYEALAWPLPRTPAEEPPLGKALTEYLWRGSDATSPNLYSFR